MQFKVKPWQHQLAAINEADPSKRNCFALFFEQGTGKTLTAINILRRIIEKEGRLPLTLILCPPAVLHNWKREILLHSDIKDWEIEILDDSQWHRLCRTDSLETGGPRNLVLITNYESLNMEKLFQRFKRVKPEVIIADESQKLKDITAKRTKRAIELAKTAQYRYLLSGTPILNSAFDIFSQYLFMDLGESFSSNLYEFRRRYFRDLNAHRPKQSYFPDWQLLPGALQKINEIVYKKAMRAVKSQCLDLPPLVKQQVTFELSDEQKRAYDAMERDCIAYLNDAAITAELKMIKAMRLLQITTGFARDDEGVDHVFTANPRAKVLEEVIQQIPRSEKFIVWGVYRQNYETIRRALSGLGIDYVEVTGEVPANKKQAAIDDFNSRPVIRALIGHPQSCGIGVNLTAASYAIYFSRTHSLENELQSEARNYRGGSERHAKITRIDIVARDTIDELVMLALSEKQDVAEAILTYLRRKSR